MWRLILSLTLLLAAAFAALACGPDDEEKVVRIGAAISTTGRYAEEGENVRRGYLLWEDWVNNEYGGIKVGADRYRVELVLYDDASDPDATADLVERLIAEDEVDFLLGPYSSTLTLPAIEVADARGVILVEGNGGSESLFERGFQNLFAVLTPAGNSTQSVLQALAASGAESIAVAHIDAIFPASVAEGAEHWAAEYGLEVLDVATYAPDATDVTDILARFKELSPDVVVGAVYFNDAVCFVRAAKAIDFSPKAMILTIGPADPAWIDEVGADAEYVLGSTQWEASMSYAGDMFGSAADYGQRYTAKWDEPPNYQSASGTAAALALQLAIEAAGSLDADAVRASLRNLDVDTFYGPIRFDATGKNTARPIGAVQVQDGAILVVAPASAAVSGLRYPAPTWQDR